MSSIIWHLKHERKSLLISFHLHFPSTLCPAFRLLIQGSLPHSGGQRWHNSSRWQSFNPPSPSVWHSHCVSFNYSGISAYPVFWVLSRKDALMNSEISTRGDDELKFSYMLYLCLFYSKEDKTEETSVFSQVKDGASRRLLPSPSTLLPRWGWTTWLIRPWRLGFQLHHLLVGCLASDLTIQRWVMVYLSWNTAWYPALTLQANKEYGCCFRSTPWSQLKCLLWSLLTQSCAGKGILGNIISS